MSAKRRSSIFTGCVASVVLESVWTAIDCAGTGPGKVSLATGLSGLRYQKFLFFWWRLFLINLSANRISGIKGVCIKQLDVFLFS